MAKSKPPTKPQDRARALVELAEDHFGGDLTNAERAMFRNAALGRETRLPDQNGDGGFYEPASGDETGPPRHWPRLLDWIADFRNKLDLRPPEPNATLESLVAWKQHAISTRALANVRLGLLPKNNPQITIRADRLRWLLIESRIQSRLDPFGVVVHGAVISGTLDLLFSRLARRLCLHSCTFNAVPRLVDASLPRLALPGCVLPGLNGDRLDAKGGIDLNGATSTGTIRLASASIGGQLRLLNCALTSATGPCIVADSIIVRGGLFLDGLIAIGEFRIIGASIGGQFTCKNASISNPNNYTLNADRITVGNSVFLDGLKSTGEVRLLGSTIEGQLNFKGGYLHNQAGAAFSADRMSARSSVFLSNLTALGEVRFVGVFIGGALSCRCVSLSNPSGQALSSHKSTIKGGVFLRSDDQNSISKFGGTVNFVESRLGSVDARGARFEVAADAGHPAIDFTDATVESSVEIGASYSSVHKPIVQSTVTGRLKLNRTRIGGKLDLAGGQFTAHPNEPAIVGAGLRIRGQIFMNRLAANHEPFRAKGPVILHGAQFGGDVFLCEGQFDNADQAESVDGSSRPRAALSLARSTIKGLLQIDSCRHRNASPLDDDAGPLGRAKDGEACTFRGPLDLSHVRVGIFRDDVATWDKSRTTGEIRLDGFVYEALGPGAPVRASDRLKLLARMPAGEFNSQPYEHLALLLDKMGHDDDAREVLIEEASRRHWFEWRHVGDWGSTIFCSILLAVSIASAGFAVVSGTLWLLAVALAVTAVIALKFSAGRRSADCLVRLVLRFTLVYGYRPLTPLLWMAALLSIGWAFFGWAASRTEQLPAYAGSQPEPVGLFAPASDQVLTWAEYTGKLTPTGGSQPIDVRKRPAEYPRFNALVFAADTMLPIIDLHQEQYWQVDPRKGAVVSVLGRDYSEGEIVRAYLWFHILAGWTLTTLFIVGLTGLVRGHKAEQVAE